MHILTLFTFFLSTIHLALGSDPTTTDLDQITTFTDFNTTAFSLQGASTATEARAFYCGPAWRFAPGDKGALVAQMWGDGKCHTMRGTGFTHARNVNCHKCLWFQYAKCYGKRYEADKSKNADGHFYTHYELKAYRCQE